MNTKIWPTLLILLLPGVLLGQYRLSDIIYLAQTQSPGYRISTTNKDIARYQYDLFKSTLRPQVLLYGDLPTYTKEYSAITQPDGTIKFLSVFQNYSTVGVGLTQKIGLTGGELSFNTALNRFDEFRTKTHQYSGTPFFIKVVQPLFAVNQIRWDKKIAPLRLEESRRQYLQELEDIGQKAASLFFDVLTAQADIGIATANLKTAEYNYSVETERVNLGTTTEDKLLQLQLQVVANQRNSKKAQYSYQAAQLSLRTFIGLKDTAEMTLLLPDKIPSLYVNADQAVEYAKKYRAEFITLERKHLEAEADIAKAKAAWQQVNLVASFGVNKAAGSIGEVYQNPNDQQMLSVGFNVPIVDWGRRRASYKVSDAIRNLTDVTNEFNAIRLVQEVVTLVNSIDYLRESATLAQKADSIAHTRFTIANNLYRTGKLSVSDLNIAQNEKDAARRDYYESLREYWNAYYFLRRITLYDFEKDQPLL